MHCIREASAVAAFFLPVQTRARKQERWRGRARVRLRVRGCANARTHTRARPTALEKMCFSSFKTPEISKLIPAFRINGTNGMQSGVHGERARLACRAVRPARHTGRPQAFGTPWVAACIPRGREIRHARRVRSPNHAILLFQPLFPVSLFLKDRMSRYPQKRPVENGRILQGRVAGGGEGIANCKLGIGNCKLRTSGLRAPGWSSSTNSVAGFRILSSTARKAGGTRPPGAFRGWNACATPGSVPGGRAPPGTYFQGLNPSFTINGADY